MRRWFGMAVSGSQGIGGRWIDWWRLDASPTEKRHWKRLVTNTDAGNGKAAMARHNGIYVVVTWDPILHLVSDDTVQTWINDRFHTTTQVWTQCGEEVTGFLDDGTNHTVTCLTCLVMGGVPR